MKVLYSLAYLKEVNQIIDINEVKEKYLGQKFFCPACASELIPVLNGQKQKHFRHHNLSNCTSNPESYLHSTAKFKIYSDLKNAIDKEEPFLLIYKAISEEGKLVEKFTDLSKYFDHVFLETKEQAFIPDILLKSQTKTLFIEIDVTHKCEEDKISSNIPIIEVNINNEEDIKRLNSSQLKQGDNELTFFNFNHQLTYYYNTPMLYREFQWAWFLNFLGVKKWLYRPLLSEYYYPSFYIEDLNVFLEVREQKENQMFKSAMSGEQIWYNPELPNFEEQLVFSKSDPDGLDCLPYFEENRMWTQPHIDYENPKEELENSFTEFYNAVISMKEKFKY